MRGRDRPAGDHCLTCRNRSRGGRLIHHSAGRDPKDPNGPHLEFNPDDWRTFTQRIRNGHHDLT
ncbi:DUF397 domain-containing protein [Actinomadura sp. NBRC 104425]|uniref:DUF397 domain-containing protein n=1 Tax=Actinomadura sp. NBRC 104425 TaxID=3032204 RepID=UPI0033319D8D